MSAHDRPFYPIVYGYLRVLRQHVNLPQVIVSKNVYVFKKRYLRARTILFDECFWYNAHFVSYRLCFSLQLKLLRDTYDCCLEYTSLLDVFYFICGYVNNGIRTVCFSGVNFIIYIPDTCSFFPFHFIQKLDKIAKLIVKFFYSFRAIQ